MNNSYLPLLPLIEKKGLVKDPAEFHSLVNIIFHDIEARYYDNIHREMWESLPAQYSLLADDILPHLRGGSAMTLLDVGCGTGLATQLLLQTSLGKKISNVNLVDTSPKMLEKAVKRSRGWGKSTRAINSTIESLDGKYDLIIISSVLHHIPDLQVFLDNVSRLQESGGILITIQDPNGGVFENTIYKERVREYIDHQNSFKTGKSSLDKRIVNKIKRVLRMPTYIDKINNKLIQQGIINEALNEGELWSVTDIHVEDLPYSTGNGISKEMLLRELHMYDLRSYRTYAFFGTLSANLDEQFRQKELLLSGMNDPLGRNFCSAWQKKFDN